MEDGQLAVVQNIPHGHDYLPGRGSQFVLCVFGAYGVLTVLCVIRKYLLKQICFNSYNFI